MTVFTVFTLNKLTLLSTVIKFFQIQEFLKGPVQTTWTEFWATLTPSPYVDTFVVVIWETPSPSFVYVVCTRPLK